MPLNTTKTICPYCGVGCGVTITPLEDGGFQVRGDKTHPANFGKLCSKGAALGETLTHEGRLFHPMVDGRETAWDEALSGMAQRFSRIIEAHGPDAVAFYVSGQLLTEDYYVANKLMKGFIGSGNIDTNSRLCMSSSVAGHKRAFGSDTVPGNFEDLEKTDLLVLTGSNLAWCHPVLYQRVVKARRQREGTDNPLRVVVIDPRRTPTCDIADLHIPLASGTDTILFDGLLNWLYELDLTEKAFVQQHTEGLDEALRQARWYAPSAAAVAEHCGVEKHLIDTFFRWYANTERVVTVYSQGVNQSSCGTDKVNAIINCHLLTGRIGREGMGPFSVTGQPNAMGGREVGGLANQLAAHMDFENEGHVRLVESFWKAPRMAQRPGLKAVDMFDAMDRGEIKAVWIMATNPAVSLPDSNRVRRALERCELVVVSDCVDTDTTRLADILLPALTWGEKDGTVTNSERRISRQRPFLPGPGEARPDWLILSQFARELGFEGFEYASVDEVFREYAALTGAQNEGERDLDISALQGIDREEYEQLEPVQWPLNAQGQGSARLFADGRFYTPSRRARFIAVTPRPPAHRIDPDYPMVLNTGRVRDQWHTMTRTGRSPRLTGHVSEPYAELHPRDARQWDVSDGDLVQVSSRWGEAIVRARVAETQQPGSVFVPMHWNDQFAGAARIDAVVNPATDPVSGQPELKHTPVRISPYHPAWHGFILSRHAVELHAVSYWCRAQREGLWHYEVAGESIPEDWAGFARALLGGSTEDAWSEMADVADARYRAARYAGDRLDACLFIAPETAGLPPRDWLTLLFAEPAIEPRQRLRVLAGTPGNGQEDKGKIICSCFSVGINTLRKAIVEDGCGTPEALGACCQAGTNCGSCVPELRALISETLAES